MMKNDEIIVCIFIVLYFGFDLLYYIFIMSWFILFMFYFVISISILFLEWI